MTSQQLSTRPQSSVLGLAAVLLLATACQPVEPVQNDSEVAQVSSEQQPDGWPNIETGWILLGLVTEENQWLTDDTFLLLDPPSKLVASSKLELPSSGDTIALVKSQEVVILGFGESGEERALEFPADAERLEKSDYTPHTLRKDLVVYVEECRTGRPSSKGVQQVWARVSRNRESNL